VIGRLAASLKPGGHLWLSEPVGHVSAELFAWEVGLAEEAGLEVVATPRHWRQMVAVLKKNPAVNSR
jgi:hypothetical protein